MIINRRDNTYVNGGQRHRPRLPQHPRRRDRLRDAPEPPQAGPGRQLRPDML